MIVEEKKVLMAEIEKSQGDMSQYHERQQKCSEQKADLEIALTEAQNKLVMTEQRRIAATNDKKALEQETVAVKKDIADIEMVITKLEQEKTNRDHTIKSLNDEIANQDEIINKLNKEKVAQVITSYLTYSIFRNTFLSAALSPARICRWPATRSTT